MTQQQAVKILISAGQKLVKRLNVNANLYEVYGLDEPSCKRAADERRRIQEAIKRLKQ